MAAKEHERNAATVADLPLRFACGVGGRPVSAASSDRELVISRDFAEAEEVGEMVPTSAHPSRTSGSGMRKMSRRTVWVAVFATGMVAGCRHFPQLPESAEPVATMQVSGGAVGAAIGMSYVQGIVSFRQARYRVIFLGVEPSSMSRGAIYHMAYVRDLEGTYTAAQNGRVRNQRGVEIAFDPPLQAPDGPFQIRFDARLTPKDNVSGSSGD